LSRSRIQKREALAIAAKLDAKIHRDGPHQLARVEFGGRVVLTFGIRHGRMGGHGHLVGRHQGELKINETGAMALASCVMSKDEYFAHLRRIGML
jgi:hypothetical protein